MIEGLRQTFMDSSIISFEMPADTSLIVVVCALVKTFAEAKGMKKEDSRRLELAVDEIATNAIMYGCGGDRAKRYRGEVETREGRVIVRIYERGPGFVLPPEQPTALPSSIQDISIGGRGILLARKMTDEIRYENNPGGENCFTIIKRIVP